MPAIVEKFFGQPIAIAILKGQITESDMEKVYAETLSFFSDSLDECFYQITDARQADFSLPETLKILSTVTQIIHTCNRSQIQFVFIGTPAWNSMAQVLLAKHAVYGMNSNLKVAFFNDMNEAIHFIRRSSAPATTS
jgi:hypothetical protein